MQYAELHCKTNFSFLHGASHADELVVRAAQLGYAALAVTDLNSLAGIARAHVAARQAQLKLVVGAEVTPVDAPAIVLWATDRAAYGRLSRLITVGRRKAEKGKCQLKLDDVARYAQGLIAGVVGRAQHPEGNGECGVNTESCLHCGDVNPFRDIFGDRCYLLGELHRGVDDRRYLQQLVELSDETRVPLVAAGDVHYHMPARMLLYDVLTSVRNGMTVADSGSRLFSNAERHLRPIQGIAEVFAAVPEAVRRTVEIADRCLFSLDQLRYEYPEELAPHGLTPHQYLVQLAWHGAGKRYPHGISEKVQALLEHELKLIKQLHYEAYFLTVWDLVRFARGRGILCQGRGSAANSAVCYCLGITAVDPDRADLLFERFVSRERNEAPDIDVDFEHERREEVLQYIYGKYGRERAGMTAEVICYRPRSAVRDVGKALGLSLDRVDALAKNLEGYHQQSDLPERCRQIGIDPDSPNGSRLVYLVNQLIGFPRHLSQHVGGMVMTQGPLCELVPIENAAMEGRTVIQWDKHDLDELGVLKVDCLSLGMLTAIRKCFDLVGKQTGQRLSLATIPAGDQQVYDMICRADTMGVFQIESRAQMSMLPRLKPRCYYDLVIEVAIVRPGPIQGNMVHPYLRRRSGQEPVIYPNEAVRRVLKKTLGVPIFQEQAMRLAVVAAGFTPGEADELRRAMGAWRRPGIIDRFRHKLLRGMFVQGLSREFAEAVFRQIRGFGEYGFPESHAASFALLVYVSAWLKCHYPAAFTAALINSQPMGFYAPAQLIRDARDHGVPVRPIDVNHSRWDCTLEVANAACGSAASHSPGSALRLGFRMIAGFSQGHVEVIQEALAGGGPFRSVRDFARRTRLGRAVLMRLARADVFRSLAQDRRAACWEALAQEKNARSMPLFEGLQTEDQGVFQLPPADIHEEVIADYQATGLSLRSHPLSFYRNQLEQLRVIPASKLATVPTDRTVRVAGLVLLRQRPSTAKGITFVTLEDETGISNLVIHQQIWQRYYSIARHSPAWIVFGQVQSKDSVIHVVVRRLEDLSERLGGLNHRSRDFR